VRPQECCPPALSPAKVSPPDTGTGIELLFVVPLPSWPHLLNPQQYAAPLVVSPQVLWVALIALKLRPPDTGTGVAASVVVPLPRRPYALLPQQ
jgi:hypothetical protein